MRPRPARYPHDTPRRLLAVRRVALLTLIPVLSMVVAACNDDGRTLREPGPDQNQSISSLGTTTDGDFVDTVVDTTTPDRSMPVAGSQALGQAPGQRARIAVELVPGDRKGFLRCGV